MNQIERTLHQEVSIRLRSAKPDCVWISPPNNFFIRKSNPLEQALANRIVYQMKQRGMITPGAADYIFLWGTGSGAVELKRGAAKTLLGRVPAGRQSDSQREFEALCEAQNVPYRICTSWAEVRDTLIAWGRLPDNYVDADSRIGPRGPQPLTVAADVGRRSGTVEARPGRKNIVVRARSLQGSMAPRGGA